MYKKAKRRKRKPSIHFVNVFSSCPSFPKRRRLIVELLCYLVMRGILVLYLCIQKCSFTSPRGCWCQILFPFCLPSWPCLINCFSSAWTILYFWCKLYCCFKNVVLFLSWWYIMIINYYFVYGHNVIIIVWFHTAFISFLFFNETRKQNV